MAAGFSISAASANTQNQNVRGDDTYTYVRCWYRTGYSHDDARSDYKWARDVNGKDFTIPGHWWASEITQWKNMFYTDVSQEEIAQRCKATLGTNNPAADILFYAADNRLSFNHTIWTNDQNKNSGKINKIIALGDSISDTGNVFNAFQWRFPNPDSWFLGHFSNGQVWSEYLAKDMGVPVYNWAVGGAAGNNQYLLLSGIQAQIDSYKEYVAVAKNYNPEESLVTLEFGLNDFMNYDRTVEEVKADFAAALVRLESLGIKNLITMKLPDASKAPQFKYETAEKRKTIRSRIIQFNAFVEEQYQYYLKRGMNIQLFDAFSLFEQLTTDPKPFGFANAKDSCMDISRSSSLDYVLSHGLTNECAAVGSDKYVFWGVTHPTTAVHKYMADQIMSEAKGKFNY
ncbi:SGNH/GDSL hydrolase family protein [Endozoicomonas sp. Mp262]|uniref:SGNH/GDSL hydrolase family protein n=1 Tax=Endozoicomonas sp. Mp262 TaxID=2919499 RepID=UPI0021DAC0A7